MSYTFTDAVKDVIQNGVNAAAQKSDAEKRYDICKQCEFFNRVVLTCGKCGCFMPAKTKLLNATCPAGKW